MGYELKVWRGNKRILGTTEEIFTERQGRGKVIVMDLDLRIGDIAQDGVTGAWEEYGYLVDVYVGCETRMCDGWSRNRNWAYLILFTDDIAVVAENYECAQKFIS